MSLVSIIIVFVIVGLILYLINTFIPMEGNVKKLMNIAVILILVLWLLQATGLISSLDVIRVR